MAGNQGKPWRVSDFHRALHRDLVREPQGARNDGPRHARLLGWAATVRRYWAEYRALGE